MSVPTAPPPTYDQDQQDELDRSLCQAQAQSSSTNSGSTATRVVPADAQLLISPSGNATHFQKGYLGASGERAAIEGELQIKGVPLSSWESLTVYLTSTESDGKHHIELNSVNVDLYSRNGPSGSNSLTVASSIPFAIPLTPDTPQCLHVGRSSLSHRLTATLQTTDPLLPILSRSITVHTKRFASHLLDREVLPHSVSPLHTPTPVHVEVARTTYGMDEPIPVYVTIPPPDRSVILDHGFTLRSVRAELIRSVNSLDIEDGRASSVSGDSVSVSEDTDTEDDSDSASSSGVPPSAEFSDAFSNSGSASYMASPLIVPRASYTGSTHPSETIVARSGSSCRFHTSRAVKLRLVLHGSFPSYSPAGTNGQLPDAARENSFADEDSQCASISQATVLHKVEYRIQVRTTFLHVSTRSERTFPLVIPVTILPPPAPLPEIDPSIDSDYRKKHDRPPAKTVRQEDSDIYTGEYEETGQAGPSALPNGAPPPFDDAPPPFFSVSIGEASTSRLPTFFESESEIIVPDGDHSAAAAGGALSPPQRTSIEGEGVLFGFPASERYDGHSDDVGREATPPPSLAMAEDDADVTELAGLVDQPARALDALNQVLEEHDDMGMGMEMEISLSLSRSRSGTGTVASDGLLPPPPPPPMDDPSDPPPSIDSEFHSRNPGPDDDDSDPPPSILNPDFRTTSAGTGVGTGVGTTTTPSVRPTVMPEAPSALDVSVSSRRPSVPEEASGISPSHAPPPYLNPVTPGDTEHVSGPPPYVDLVPSTTPNQSH